MRRVTKRTSVLWAVLGVLALTVALPTAHGQMIQVAQVDSAAGTSAGLVYPVDSEPAPSLEAIGLAARDGRFLAVLADETTAVHSYFLIHEGWLGQRWARSAPMYESDEGIWTFSDGGFLHAVEWANGHPGNVVYIDPNEVEHQLAPVEIPGVSDAQASAIWDMLRTRPHVQAVPAGQVDPSEEEQPLRSDLEAKVDVLCAWKATVKCFRTFGGCKAYCDYATRFLTSERFVCDLRCLGGGIVCFIVEVLHCVEISVGTDGGASP